MNNKSSNYLIEKVVTYLIVMWGVLFIPAIFMAILVITGHGNVTAHTEISWKLLYYNLVLFPVVILGSCSFSWILLKKKHYNQAIFAVLVPFIAVFIETVLVDILLLFL